MIGRSFDKLMAEAETLVRVWADNPAFSLGDVTMASLQALLATAKATRSSTAALRTQLTKGINDVNSQRAMLADIVSRGRSGMRAQFGVDSTQYSQVGGTRAIDRKPRRRKPAPAAAS